MKKLLLLFIIIPLICESAGTNKFSFEADVSFMVFCGYSIELPFKNILDSIENDIETGETKIAVSKLEMLNYALDKEWGNTRYLPEDYKELITTNKQYVNTKKIVDKHFQSLGLSTNLYSDFFAIRNIDGKNQVQEPLQEILNCIQKNLTAKKNHLALMQIQALSYAFKVPSAQYEDSLPINYKDIIINYSITDNFILNTAIDNLRIKPDPLRLVDASSFFSWKVREIFEGYVYEGSLTSTNSYNVKLVYGELKKFFKPKVKYREDTYGNHKIVWYRGSDYRGAESICIFSLVEYDKINAHKKEFDYDSDSDDDSMDLFTVDDFRYYKYKEHKGDAIYDLWIGIVADSPSELNEIIKHLFKELNL